MAPTKKSDSLNKKSLSIDRSIRDEAKRKPREFQALVLGSESRLDILAAAKLKGGKSYTSDELNSYKRLVIKILTECARAIVQEIRRLKIDPEAKYFWRYVELIDGYCNGLELSTKTYWELDPAFVNALESILQNPRVSGLLEPSGESALPSSAEYFFAEISRISSFDYMPTEMDIIQATSSSTGIYDTRLRVNDLSIHLFDIGGLSGKIKKWIHHFDAAKFIIFVVDLDQYNQGSRMAENMRLFETMVNSKWFIKGSIILLLNKTATCRNKLQTSPLADYFLDYTGGRDIRKAADYILGRFYNLNREGVPVYPCVAENSDVSTLGCVLATMKEALLNEYLRDTTRIF
ncbi:guanine nucleotide-binding protein alpha-3 subunit [Pseudomassariella vexata]|uniref:Guanine nucleotide-binding protein alpha-3 subunit n=1 Tax=Pseudomassariella vexata TaxID=1141098 RepID=A0A1Y2EF73_9PEZI|nr:guanine nucleotide-binding protein alpha-3 subunit [Pseudomassariella vexata]ORY70231.1 guanine nucleotide-binding protein alpha-3 subunit [Pseudomassariella vexata]